jgi:hypothetical protein
VIVMVIRNLNNISCIAGVKHCYSENPVQITDRICLLALHGPVVLV